MKNSLIIPAGEAVISTDQDLRPLRSPIPINYKEALAMREIALSMGTELPRYLLSPEINLLLNYLPDVRQQFFYRTLWNTGVRINEALSLTRDSFCLDVPVPFVRVKTLKQRNRGPGARKKGDTGIRNIPLTDPHYIQAFREYVASFTITRGNQLLWNVSSDNTPRNWLGQALKRAKSDGVTFTVEPITPHTFRHSFCMHLILSGVPLKLIQKYAGHARLESTEIYTQVFLLDAARYYPVNFTD